MDITLTDIETYSSMKQNKKFDGKRIGKIKLKAILLDFVKYLEMKPKEEILIRNVEFKPKYNEPISQTSKHSQVINKKLENEIKKLKED